MIVRVTTTFLWMGQGMQNVFYMTNPDGVLTLSGVVDDIVANWIDALRHAVDDDAVWTNLEAKNMDDTSLAPYNRTVAIHPINDHGSQQVPYMAGVIRIFTGLAGRRGHGRVFIPGLSTAHTANGVMSSDGITFWNTNVITPLKAAYLESSTVSPLWIGVYHRDTHTLTQATDLGLRAIPGVQRRRNIGVGM